MDKEPGAAWDSPGEGQGSRQQWEDKSANYSEYSRFPGMYKNESWTFNFSNGGYRLGADFLMDRSLWAKGLTGDVAVWCHRTVSYIAATGHVVTAPLREDKSGDICTVRKTVSWILTGMADGR